METQVGATLNNGSNALAFVTRLLIGFRKKMRQYTLRYTVGNSLTSSIASHFA